MSARPPFDPSSFFLAAPMAAGKPPSARPWTSAWRWWQPQQGSVRRTILTALAALVVFTAASAINTRHQLSYRVHDYAILNLAGQLREMASSMQLDALQLTRTHPAALTEREVAAYHVRLLRSASQFDRIVKSFETRSLSPDLTGLDNPVSCNWDDASLQQLRATAKVWHSLRHSVAPALDANADRNTVQTAATVIAAGGERVLESSRTLSHAFKAMMQRKLDTVIALQLGVVVLAVLAGVAMLAWLRRRVLQPLHAAEQAALRLMDGDLHVHLSTEGNSEITAVSDALNRLSARLGLLFDLADRTNAGLTTSELLDTLRTALQPVVKIDLICVAVRNAHDARGWRIHRTSGQTGRRLTDGIALAAGPSHIEVTAELASAAGDDGFAAVLVVPLQNTADEGSVLVFAARHSDTFPLPTQAMLRSVAGPVRAQLERTLSTEALLVAAVEGLAKLAESRDPETGDHLVRMSAYSAMLGAELAQDPARNAGIDARYLEDLHRFAPMHDIGKVGIADSILLKPGRLTDEERTEMCRHPLIGAEVLRRCEAQMLARGRSVFKVGIEIAEGHHEKWDGSGYPYGLAGEAIPLAARIVAVADVFDALTSKRPYKEAWPIERALATIDADSGRHFDPAIVAALHRRWPEIQAFYEQHKHV